jgi:diguanylate cyclase (GGDEF)-like protein
MDKEFTQDELLYYLQANNFQHKSKLKECKTDLLSKYFTDQLTGFPNLYQLRRDVQDSQDKTYICMTIDNFKMINDFYGFFVGDYILEQMTLKLQNSIKNAQIYRISGAEFGILIEEMLDFYSLKNYLIELNDQFKNLSFVYQNSVIFTSITLASAAGENHSNLFSKVSMALKYAKEMKLPFWIYEDRMNFESEYKLNIVTSFKVKKAIENSGVIPYFQPILCNKTGKIMKFESLARLKDEDGTILSPVQFIPIAKAIKVYTQVTKAVIEKSFEIFKENEYELSINLSIEDIMSAEIYSFIIENLKKYGIGNRVTFELLESEAIIDYKKVLRFITEVKRFGSKIAIDDFGSGYSNFAYLTRIKVDYIKIDGSLIRDIDINENSKLITETIVAFAKKMNIETIAEYVHSSTVESIVRELGIDYSQGYHIDEPLPKLPCM